MEIRDPIVVYNKKKISIEEYLRFERESVEKHEFYLRIPVVDVTIALADMYDGTKIH